MIVLAPRFLVSRLRKVSTTCLVLLSGFPPDRLALNSLVIPMKWDHLSADKSILGPNTA